MPREKTGSSGIVANVRISVGIRPLSEFDERVWTAKGEDGEVRVEGDASDGWGKVGGGRFYCGGNKGVEGVGRVDVWAVMGTTGTTAAARTGVRWVVVREDAASSAARLVVQRFARMMQVVQMVVVVVVHARIDRFRRVEESAVTQMLCRTDGGKVAHDRLTQRRKRLEMRQKHRLWRSTRTKRLGSRSDCTQRNPLVHRHARELPTQFAAQTRTRDRRAHAHIPQPHFAVHAGGHQLARAAFLQMYVLHPRLVLLPQPHQARLGWVASIVDTHRAVSEPGDKEVPKV